MCPLRYPSKVAIGVLALLLGCGAVDRARGLLGINESDDDSPAQAEPPTEAGPDADGGPESDAEAAAPEPASAEPPEKGSGVLSGALASLADAAAQAPTTPAVQNAASSPGPISFAELELEPSSTPFGAGKHIDLRAKATLHRLVSSEAQLPIKLRCRYDGEVYASNGQIPLPLAEQEVGKELELSTDLVAPATPTDREPCELEMMLDGLTKKPLGTWCWNGSELAKGTCATPVVAKAPAKGGDVLEVVSVEKSATSGPASLGLDLAVRVLDADRVGATAYGSATLLVKAACDRDGRKVARRTGAPLPWGKLRLEAGEIALSHADVPTAVSGGPVGRCDVDVMVDQSTGMGPKRDVVKRVCIDGTSVTEGRCDGKPVPTASAVKATASNVELGDVSFSTSGLGDHQQLAAELMLSVTEPIGTGSNIQIATRCRGTGGMFEAGLYVSGDIELNELLAGESAAMVGSTYFPTPDPLRWCQMKVTIEDMFGSSTPLSTWCHRGGKTKRGKC